MKKNQKVTFDDLLLDLEEDLKGQTVRKKEKVDKLYHPYSHGRSPHDGSL